MAYSDTTIESFKTAMSMGGFRPNQYRVGIRFPDAIAKEFTAAPEVAAYMCRAASVPGCIIQPATVMYRGRQVNFAGERVYQPWTATFYLDVDFGLRDMFETWSDYIRKIERTDGTIIHDNYYSDIDVTPLTRNNEDKRNYRLIVAWPSNISPITLNYEANNIVGQFDIEFIYNYYTFEHSSGTAASDATNRTSDDGMGTIPRTA
jgi:hypothetical protein